MPRHPRVSALHSFAHVTAKGNRGVSIFVDDEDRRFFLSWLEAYARKYAVRIHAYCLMTTHFHLLIEVGDSPMSILMQRLMQRHAQHINRRYGHRGHLFGDRFWSQLCERDNYLLGVVRYIHLNPVWAGLVVRPELYSWSSHNAYLGLNGTSWITTGYILEMFARNRSEAVEAYVLFIEDELPTRVAWGSFE